jgi:predicted dehydrogenase
MGDNQTVRWGIIGCGNVTEVKSGPGFQKAAGSKLVAVMRRNGALAQDYAKRHNVPRWYDDADKLIADPEVDAVYVATPPGSHLEIAQKVAAAGKPCYMEKPMARSWEECRQMLQAFMQARMPLFVAYYRRAQPRFVKVKELIDSGALGRVTGVRYHISRAFNPTPAPEWRLSAEQSGGGIFLDIGSHVIDLLDHLVGEFVEYGGSASTSGAAPVEDAVSLHFRTARGVIGTALWNFADCKNEELLEIAGTQGRITMEVFTPGSFDLHRDGKVQRVEIPDPTHVAQPLIQTVVDELLGKGKCPSTGLTAARTSKVMDACLNTFYNGREDAFWARPKTWRTA